METLITHSSPIGDTPKEIQVIPFGRHATAQGEFVLDREGISEIVAEFNLRANDLVIDYEHQTLGGVEAPAAGWIKTLIDRGVDGLWAAVQWTPRAAGYLRDREYRYLSPVFIKRASDARVVRLVNAALTNQPAIDGMVPVMNRAIAADPQKEGGKEMQMQMQKIMEALGLDATLGEAEATAAIAALRDKLRAVIESIGLQPDADSAEITGTLCAMKQAHEQFAALAARVGELEAALGGHEAEGLITQAMREGKLTPAQRAWADDYAARDIDGFRVFVAKAPIVVPVTDAPSHAVSRKSRIDETQHRVNAYLGISAEAFGHYGN